MNREDFFCLVSVILLCAVFVFAIFSSSMSSQEKCLEKLVEEECSKNGMGWNAFSVPEEGMTPEDFSFFCDDAIERSFENNDLMGCFE